MHRITIVLQDAPYGNEKVWNALRLSEALVREGVEVKIFLYGDSVISAKKGQSPPKGYYNIEEMLKGLIEKGVEVRSCLTCTKARGLKEEDYIDGAIIGKTIDLARWLKESDGVMVF